MAEDGITGFSKVFESRGGFDILCNKGDVESFSEYLGTIAVVAGQMMLPCFGRYGYGTGWCAGAPVQIPMCQNVCPKRDDCFGKFQEDLELNPAIRSLMDGFLKGIPKCAPRRLDAIVEGFKKLGFSDANPIFSKVGENASSGFEAKKGLLKAIILN